MIVTASASLLAVTVGAWIAWRRDETRRWCDHRLGRYIDFIEAFREYLAYLQLPDTRITAIRRQRPPHDRMPILDGDGVAYSQRLDAAKTKMVLVSRNPATIAAAREMVHAARHLAATRATTEPAAIPADLFDRAWDAERAFVRRARRELGLRTATALNHPHLTHRETPVTSSN